MLILNYYYNDYDEIDIESMKNGTSTKTENVAVVILSTIGSIFLLFIIFVPILLCCFYSNRSDEEIEIVTTTVV